MCVIAVKKQGADFPSKKVITACMKENPHGFAAAWNQNGRLMTFRTMDEAEMIAKYDEIRRLDPAATALVFHARIATHGSKTLANCHCWTNDDGTLAFAHNGVLDNIQVCGDMTDSETFFRDIYLPVLEGAGPETAEKVAAAVAGHSKFAFIRADGTVSLTGSWSKDQEDGHKGMVYFSNMNWRRRMPGAELTFPFDRPVRRTKTPETIVIRCPKPKRGSLVIERSEDGSVKNMYVREAPADETSGKASGRLFR